MIRKREIGDTIIEVLLAVTVFSMVASGALLIMNKSVAAAQRALEITQVRQQIDAQAEALRAIHEAAAKADSLDGSIWSGIALRADGAEVFEAEGCPVPSSEDDTDRELPNNAFVLNPLSATVLDAPWYERAGATGQVNIPPYAQVVKTNDTEPYKAYGLWIEPSVDESGTNGAPKAYNFNIRACWDDPSSDTALTISTIVRLYEL